MSLQSSTSRLFPPAFVEHYHAGLTKKQRDQVFVTRHLHCTHSPLALHCTHSPLALHPLSLAHHLLITDVRCIDSLSRTKHAWLLQPSPSVSNSSHAFNCCYELARLHFASNCFESTRYGHRQARRSVCGALWIPAVTGGVPAGKSLRLDTSSFIFF